MEGVLYVCCLVSKLYCIELCIDYSVVLFLYRWSVQNQQCGVVSMNPEVCL